MNTATKIPHPKLHLIAITLTLLTALGACKKGLNHSAETAVTQNETPSSGFRANSIIGVDEFYIATCNITTDKIEIYNPNDATWNSSTVKWSWSPTTALNYTSNEVNAWGNPIDVKQRRVVSFDGNNTYMAIAGGNLATVVDRATSKKKWAIVLSEAPRAIELLPNGNTAVASYAGNWLRVYASSQGASNTANASVTVTGIRGMVYDYINEILWAVTDNSLKAYDISGLSAPTITEKTALAVALPSSSQGFDVSPYYGDLNKLCVSTTTGTYIFDKTTNTFTATAGASFRTSATGFSNQGTGMMVETRNEVPNACPVLCDDAVEFYNPNGSLAYTRSVTGCKFAKAKTITEYYQTRSNYAIATYNVRYRNATDDAEGNGWNVRHRFIAQNVIKKYNFDIFGVQEPFSDQIDDMKNDLGGYATFGVSDDNKATSTSVYHFHNIFYKTSRFTLLDDGKFWLAPGGPSTPPTDMETGAWGGKPKVCIWGKFQDKLNPSSIFYVFNTHFYPFTPASPYTGSQLRDSSATVVLQKIAQIAGSLPAIFMGDLNSGQGTDPFNVLNNSTLLEQSWAWASTRLPVTPTERQRLTSCTFDYSNPPTFTNYPEGRQIDHVFLTSQWQNKVKLHWVLWERYNVDGWRRPSDHNSVMIELAPL